MTDWSKCQAVESVPGKVSGAWVFKDTRLPVSAPFRQPCGGRNRPRLHRVVRRGGRSAGKSGLGVHRAGPRRQGR